MKLRTAIRTTVCSLVLAGALMVPSVASAARVYVRVGPPAPIVEVRTARPGPRHVWVQGYHTWNGTAYVWAPGRWIVPPRAHARWIPARWVRDRRHGWYIVEGHWR